ncbi:MAG: GNAT family N-acetyltransferase [Vampirovibrio sp.]|nr:GNAT family N-acetyltransferase [Vampirovibrio sp.]
MLFKTDLYKQLWWRHIHPQLDTAGHQDDFVILNKRVLKGLYAVKQLHIIGWENDWAQDMTPEVMETFVDMSEEKSWDYFKVVTRKQDETNNPFEEFIKGKQFPVFQWESGAEYLISFENGWDAYWEDLSSKVRCEYRRKLKKAQSQNPVFRLLNHDENLEEHLDLFFNHHIAYWETKGETSLFAKPGEQEFFRSWAKELMPSNQVRFYGLFLNDELVSMRFGVMEDDRYYSMVTVNTREQHAYSPGVLALYYEMEHTYQTGCKIYNMGPGFFRYKRDLGATVSPYATTMVANPKSKTGKLVVSMKKQEVTQKQAEAVASS